MRTVLMNRPPDSRPRAHGTLLRRRAWRGGFTLPEMVIAIVVVGIGLSVFAVTLGISARAANAARRQMTAMNYARAAIEDLRDVAYNDPALSTGTHSISNNQYSGSYVVANIVTNQRKSISMRINWVNASKGQTTNVTYTTQFSNALH